MGLVNLAEHVRRPPSTRVPNMPAPAPPPVIGPTGSVGLDAVADVINRSVAPFRSAPDPRQGVCGVIQHYVGGALGLVGAPFELMDTGFAMITAPLAALFPGMPAATLLVPHLAPPHAHAHPPSLIPPAPPVPLPSIGSVLLPGCVSVLVGGLPAARAGDMGLALTCGSLSPAFDIFTGSSNTWIGGSRAARIFDITRHCNPASAASGFAKAMMAVGAAMNLVGAGAQASAGNSMAAAAAAAQAAADAASIALAALLGKDPGIPPGMGVLMLGNPLVLIGGFPMPDLMELITGLLKGITKGLKRLRELQRNSRFWQRLSNALRGRASRAMQRLGIGRGTRTRVSRLICFLTGHPVDVVSGNVFTSATDFVLPGPLPLGFEREWHSNEDYAGSLGNGWHHRFDLALCELDGAVALRLADGRSVAFPALAPGDSHFDRNERITLLRDRTGYALRMRGLLWRFGEPTGDAQPLLAIEDRGGLAIRLEWRSTATGRHALVGIIDSGGRRYRIEHDEHGRLSAVLGPSSEGGARALVRYVYDRLGNLIEARDALDQPTRYTYAGKLMVRETNRRGLSFHFAYEGEGPGSRCIRTWGDEGIFDHRIVYDDATKQTIVTNSLGHVTRYQRDDNGLATAVTDAKGGTWTTVYNEFAQPVVERDPLARTTFYAYDERGNVSKVVAADGAVAEIGWHEDRPVVAVDPAGGWWQWRYDERGRTIGRDEPDGRRFRWRYQGAYLTELRGPEGTTQLGYDSAGNLAALREPSGALWRWTYDGLGRPIEAIDPSGGVTRRRYDLLDRVIERIDPDARARVIEWDPLDKPRAIRDDQRELRFAWTGLGKLREVEESGLHERREYDSEGRLIALVDNAGRRHRFERDAVGEIVAEIDVDQRRREYVRNAGGEVEELVRPSGAVDRFERDGAGRVTKLTRADGSETSYVYGHNGQLVEIRKGECTIRWTHDAAGRVLDEQQIFAGQQHGITSTYDRAGRRVQLRSSLGAEIAYTYDADGNQRSVEAREGATSFRAHVTRDALGRELERVLPGNVVSRWAYDPLGRPLEQVVHYSGRVHEQRRYAWQGDQLRQLLQIADTGTEQLTRFGHDERGFLTWARYADGETELRAVDEFGNLFRRWDRSDRNYAPDGRLLASTSSDGITRYEYDADGRLTSRVTPKGRWSYEWSDADELIAVVRPDRRRVEFVYDPLGRRIGKRWRGRVIRWLWDGERLLHEWIELDPAAPHEPSELPRPALADAEPPPLERSPATPATGPPELTKALVTWVFDADGTQLAARLCDGAALSVVSDHLGTPLALHDHAGRRVWAQELSIYGAQRATSGEPDLCPFRWPGQHHDPETGLSYNRFRWYDPERGGYISPDPLGTRGSGTAYGYVVDPLRACDPLGLRDIIVIGENQARRVVPTAKSLGAREIRREWPADRMHTRRQPDGSMFPDDFADSIAFNRDWIRDRINEGAIVVDVGRDPARVAAGDPISPWYEMELDELRRAGYTTALDNASAWRPPGAKDKVHFPEGVRGRVMAPPRDQRQQGGCE